MDITKMEEAVKRFIELMNANDLAELELEDEGTRVRIRKGGEHPGAAAPAVVAKIESAPASASQAPAKAPGAAADGKAQQLVEIPSPLVGTFYRSPSPDADPFVEVGDVVDTETVLCIVEAMKVMNEIKSELEGEIVEILVENGEPVEFGQVLFLIKPSYT